MARLPPYSWTLASYEQLRRSIFHHSYLCPRLRCCCFLLCLRALLLATRRGARRRCCAARTRDALVSTIGDFQAPLYFKELSMSPSTCAVRPPMLSNMNQESEREKKDQRDHLDDLRRDCARTTTTIYNTRYEIFWKITSAIKRGLVCANVNALGRGGAAPARVARWRRGTARTHPRTPARSQKSTPTKRTFILYTRRSRAQKACGRESTV